MKMLNTERRVYHRRFVHLARENALLASGLVLAARLAGWLPGQGSVLAAENETPPPPPLAVKLGLDPQTRLWTAMVDGREAVNGGDFRSKAAPVVREGVKFETDEDRRFLIVGPAPAPMEITVAGFPDWVVAVPASNVCAVRINESQRLVDLATPKENTTNLTVRFPDGGRAEVWPVSFARYDLMDDASYYFSGQGRVEATEADGVKKLLSPQGYPMTGGPLTEYQDDKGRRRLRRIIPPMALSISGEIGQKVAISTESGVVTLLPNQSTVIETENGELVSLLHDAADGWLRFRVQKGYFHFHIPEIRCWRGQGITDQQGAIQWGGDAHAVDLRNTTDQAVHPPNRFVIAALSHSKTGSVGSGSTLQYIQYDECNRFSVHGIGQEVALHDTRSGAVTPLGNAPILVQIGRPTGGVVGVPDTLISQGAGGTIIVRSGGTSVGVTPGGERTIAGPNGQDLQVSVGRDGTVRITALNGDHTFGASPLGDWTFTVGEGDTFIFQPTDRRDIFVVSAGEGNSRPLEVFSPEGFRPQLPGDTSLTFITADTGTTVERRGGLLVFYEQGEGVGELPFGVAEVSPPSMDARGTPQPFGRLISHGDPTQLIPPTIPVPPASVVGGN